MTVQSPKVALSDGFLGAFARLPKAQQKKVQEFISKFRQDPTSNGLNYEKIHDARSQNVHSVRIDQTYRGIVLKPEQGSIYMMMWVDKHDEAYDWARRHDCSIHPLTGAIQVVDTSYIKAVPEVLEVPAAEIQKPKLLSAYTAEQILALGVPPVFIKQVMALTDIADFQSLEQVMPAEAWEPLHWLIEGFDYQEVLEEFNDHPDSPVDTTDFSEAISRSKRRFYVVENEQELIQMLNAPLEKWRVFLHPSQRKLVESPAAGPVRVLGGAGTGKTVVAMHRARWLAQRLVDQPGKKVLFTTFTRNLAADIRNNLQRLCTREEMARIEVVNIDAWITDQLKRHGYDFKVVYDNDEGRRRCWQYAMQQAPAELGLPEGFYAEEWLRVVQPNSVYTRDEYLKVSRLGRGTALSRIQRAKIWPVFEEFRSQMDRAKLREMADATHEARVLFKEKQLQLPYSSIVVDEAQDIGSPAFTLIRSLVPESPNDLFIVGDGHQRIYRNKVVLGHCGINVRGRRSKKLKINYRTTEETRKFAVALLSGVQVDDLDGEQDAGNDYLSLLHGDKPTITHAADFKSEALTIVNQIKALLADGIRSQDICLTARTKHIYERYASALNEGGIPTFILGHDSADSGLKEGVRVATMHRIKGLEFQYVFLASINDGVVPEPKAVNSEDPVEQRDAIFNERALLHVAATRAIKGLFISSSGKPSQLLVVW
ncbi:ATP-dependent helicase [Shewanella algae]|uniref:ATP-dependent helicase n=1 Tax=Shewanella algae TaxID=38313 RepID=UPI00293589B0|nr:ATP-dependent helicase [Shewanella algae]MDV2961148.1 ATP-dependent helicase [Shewanella algae]